MQDGDSSLIKVDPSGHPVWARTLKGLDSFFWILEIHQTKDGGYIAAGSAFPFIPASASNLDSEKFYVWLMKLGGHGNTQWGKSFNVSGIQDLRQTSDGGYAFSTSAGSLLKVDKNVNLQWQKKYGVELQLVMETARDGGFWLAGKRLGQKVRILKTTSTGEIQCQKQYLTQDFISDIDTLTDGGVLLSGGTKFNDGKAVVYRIDSSGNLTWRKTYGLPIQANSSKIMKLSDGGILIAAGRSLLKTDENGEIANTCTPFIQTSTPNTTSSSLISSNRSPNVKVSILATDSSVLVQLEAKLRRRVYAIP